MPGGENDGTINWSVIDRWPVHPGLVDAIALNIEDQLAKYPEDTKKEVVLLFSAHSLPMSVINRGKLLSSSSVASGSNSNQAIRTPPKWQLLSMRLCND